MIRQGLLALALAFGTSGIAEARSHCPPGMNWRHGQCIAIPGRHTPEHFFRQDDRRRGNGNSYFYDMRRGDRDDRYQHRRFDNDRQRDLPPLRRGQHYEVINGQVVRVDENTDTFGALLGLIQNLSN